MATKTKYQVKSGDQWITCTKAVEVERGFLHYNLKDGTNGLTMTRTANYIRATIVLTMGLLTAYGILPLIMRVM